MKKDFFMSWMNDIYKKSLSKIPESKSVFKTSSDIEINPVYTDLDLPKNIEHELPGVYPFMRGIQPTMYRSKSWTMRQYSGFGTADDTNKRFKYLINEGQTGLSIAFDLPTQMGYDSDHDMSRGEVGKTGVAIDSLEDMETLFDGIDLGKVSTSMTINSTAPILLALYLACASKKNIPFDKLRGTVQNDILKEYIARGTYIYPPEPSLRIATDIFEYCTLNVPKWNTISISGYHIREAGSTAAQELAFTIEDAITYVQYAAHRGLDIDGFASRLSFFFNAHNDFFEEIAKFRAARILWADIMKNRFCAKSDKSMMLRFHTQTGGSTLTAQQPDNNVVRVALQALAAVLGGTQSLHTNSRDEALSLPTLATARLALRTQQIIAEESNVTATVDPLAGSYYVEYLTDALKSKALEYIEKIEEMGGMIKAIKCGYVQNEIQRSAYETQCRIEKNAQIVVGVNRYRIEDEQPPEIFKRPADVEEKQIEKLDALKKKRNNAKVEEALGALKTASLGKDNLMPFILDAVRVYATLGEISDTLRKVFGQYNEILF